VRLITMPFSHYSEKARWALDFTGLGYTEDAHLPMAHLLATLPVGGRSVPVLVDGDTVVTDSTEILLYLDGKAPPGKRLLPEDTAERAAALDLEDFADRRVGTAARSWIYSEMLGDPWSLGKRLGRNRPPLERALLPAAMTLARRGIVRAYGATPERAAEWRGKLRAAFDEVSRRLAASSGRYLVGDRFSAADLTFAALAAPALFPPEHPGMRGSPEELPAPVRAVIDELRSTPAGQHALRMYRDHRSG
jgi:glutathione S-transferase